jgi:magnesium chelatase subunit I
VVLQEARLPRADGIALHVPGFLQDVIAEVTLQARESADVNQTSGVSVRMSIANYETLAANAVRRALRLGASEAVPRISDLPALAGATAGKLELEYAGQERTPAEVVGDLVKRATKRVFDALVPLEGIASVVEAFEQGWKVEVSAAMPSHEYLEGLDAIAGLRDAAARLAGGDTPPRLASAIEFVLEGLHLANRLNKDESDGRVQYARR